LQDPALYAAGTVHRTFFSRDLRIVIPTVNVTQNIKQTIKKGEYVDLASLLTNNQHHDSKQKSIFQQGDLILQPDQNF
jgi:N-dimethylarginine dimethylaminohydrolase